MVEMTRPAAKRGAIKFRPGGPYAARTVTRTDSGGWCTAVLATGAQCFTGWEDPIHAKPTEAAR